jgi:Na+/H+ antiporter NhaB
VRQQQLRLIVFGIAIVLIAVAAVAEPPGPVGGVGYAVVVLAIIFTVVRERRH